MLSESSRNQKSMWTKLPAALRWISAVHHCTLCDTYHQLNTKHDKELLRNNLLFNSVQYSEVLQWKTTKPSHQITRAENSCHCFGKFIRQCMKNTMDDENVRNMDVNRVQLLFHNWISGHATASPSRAGDRDPWTCTAWLQRDIFLERQQSVLHFTNLDCVGEWPDGRRQEFTKRHWKILSAWCKRLWSDKMSAGDL